MTQTLIKYDGAALGTPGSCCPHVLMIQIGAVVGPDVLSVSLDMDPLYRTEGEELWVYFESELTTQEADDALAVVELHSSTDTVPAASIMVTTASGDIQPGGQCWVSTAGGAVNLVLPPISTAKKKQHITIKRVGANALTILPSASEPSITIEGAASMAVEDGAQAVLGPDGSQWVNLGAG